MKNPRHMMRLWLNSMRYGIFSSLKKQVLDIESLLPYHQTAQLIENTKTKTVKP